MGRQLDPVLLSQYFQDWQEWARMCLWPQAVRKRNGQGWQSQVSQISLTGKITKHLNTTFKHLIKTLRLPSSLAMFSSWSYIDSIIWIFDISRFRVVKACLSSWLGPCWSGLTSNDWYACIMPTGDKIPPPPKHWKLCIHNSISIYFNQLMVIKSLE